MINKELATDLKTLINHFQSSLNAIKALDLNILLHEVLLFQILIEHVIEVMRKQWEMKAVSQGIFVRHCFTIQNIPNCIHRRYS
jgi:hypothetical protein